ncbi:MAG: sodium:solute symporter family protein [Acidobacteria bacterium]|nr:sodium:solute symporter family protein [Acidobacteriota bacterium]
MNRYLWLLLLYSLLLIGIGVIASRKVRSAADFYVAGRSLGPGLLFSTLLAANIGASSTVGAAGLGYQYGLSAWWWVGSAGLGSLILAFVIGPRMRRLALGHGFFTFGDFLEWRYNRSVRLLAAALLWLGTLALLAAQLVGVSIILHVVAGISREIGYWMGGIVVIIYFAAGGLHSAARVNSVELAIKLAGFFAALAWALQASGGWTQIAERAASMRVEEAQSASYLSPFGAGPKWIVNYLILLTPSFFISPGLLQKVFGARDDSAVKWGVGLNAIGLLLFAAVPALLGIIAFVHFPNLTDPQDALPTVMVQLLPLPLGMFALAAVFSAEISTCDAILFMLSTSWSNDLYRSVFRPRADSKELLRAGRWAALAGGLAGILLAQYLQSIIGAIALFYGLLVVALFMPLVLGLFSPAPRAPDAVTAMLLAVTAAGLAHLATGGRGWGTLAPPSIGILVSGLVFLVFWGVRRIGASKADIDRADGVKP